MTSAAQEAFRRARQFNRLDDKQKAMVEYDKVIALDPNHTRTYFYRSNLLSLMGEHERAYEDAQKLLELSMAQGDKAMIDMAEEHLEMLERAEKEDKLEASGYDDELAD